MHTYSQDLRDKGRFVIQFISGNAVIEIARRERESDAIVLVNFLNGGSGIWPFDWHTPK